MVPLPSVLSRLVLGRHPHFKLGIPWRSSVPQESDRTIPVSSMHQTQCSPCYLDTWSGICWATMGN